jgi:hypothetical protein
MHMLCVMLKESALQPDCTGDQGHPDCRYPLCSQNVEEIKSILNAARTVPGDPKAVAKATSA